MGFSHQKSVKLWLSDSLFLIIHEGWWACKHAADAFEIFKCASWREKKRENAGVYVCERESEQHVCECGRVSIITEINSFPLFPLSPWVSAHTAAALSSVWNSAKDTCGSTMCTLYLCTTLKVSTRDQQRDSAVCQSSVGVKQRFTELPAEPPTVQRCKEEMIIGYDWWFWLWNGRWCCGGLSQYGIIMYGLLAPTWSEKTDISHAHMPELGDSSTSPFMDFQWKCMVMLWACNFNVLQNCVRFQEKISC